MSTKEAQKKKSASERKDSAGKNADKKTEAGDSKARLSPRRIANSKFAVLRAERQKALAEKRETERQTRLEAEKKARAERQKLGVDRTGSDALFANGRRAGVDRAEKKRHMPLQSPQAAVRRTIYTVLSVIIVVALGCAGFFFLKWRVEIIATDREIEEIQSLVAVEETTGGAGTEAILSDEDPGSVFWTYLKSSLIHVDFAALTATNAETAGWVQVPSTSIDYPYVQTTDNDYYLTHSFDNTENDAGWVFLDRRNNSQLSRNTNSIIYAHGRLDGTMFGTLKNVLTSEWQANADNHVVRISTPEEDTLWQIFSVYRIGNTNDYLYTEFNTETEHGEFLDMLVARSAYTFDAKVSTTDHILTLSTCIGTNERVVVHAKLIKVSYN